MRRPSVAWVGVAGGLLIGLAVGLNWAQGPRAALQAAPASAGGSAAPTASAGPRIGLPRPDLTPGSINPNVTPATMAETICKAGWTATVRPPSAYTSGLKVAQIVLYGYEDRDPTHYQEDHLVPLQLGGAPRDPRNLWPLPLTIRFPDGTTMNGLEKDDLGDLMKRQVCSGTLPLDEAQRAIAGDWQATWVAFGRP